MAKIRTGLPGAADRMQLLADDRKLRRRLKRAARTVGPKGKKAMGQAVAWWHAKALPRIPVRGSGTGKYSRTGRGFLKKRTQPFVKAGSEVVSGGIRSMADYAIWLAAGTRRIAKGRVMRWNPGQQLITSWPAKRAGGNPRGAMPILFPWHRPAQEQLLTKLRKGLI